MSAKSNQTRRSRKLVPPQRPYVGFPLTPHASGKFQKQVRINGELKTIYFGAWALRVDKVLTLVEDGGWREAEELYNAWKKQQDNLEREAAALRAKHDAEQRQAEEQRLAKLEAEATGELRLIQLCNWFLDFKRKKVKSGQRAPTSYSDWTLGTRVLLEVFGKNKVVVIGQNKANDSFGPTDFARLREWTVEEGYAPGTIRKILSLTKQIFKLAWKAELIEREPNYGHDFEPPTKKEVKKYKAQGGKRMFTHEEILLLMDGGWITGKQGEQVFVKPSTQMRCMILLGINCAFKNTDIGELSLKHIDLKAGLIRFPRTKTWTERECPLWPETIQAIADVMNERPKTKLSNLFITKYGNPWTSAELVPMADSDGMKLKANDAVKLQFGKLLKAFHINGRRGLGFSVLRRNFDTIGLQLPDRDGVKAIMGQEIQDISEEYNEEMVPLARRLVVVNHVRQWLFGSATAKKATTRATATKSKATKKKPK